MTPIEAMEKYGGSFVQSLALCWLRADPNNRAKLEAAFQDVFRKYERVAELASQRGEA